MYSNTLRLFRPYRIFVPWNGEHGTRVNILLTNLIDDAPLIDVLVGVVGSIINQSTMQLTDLAGTMRIRAIVDTGSNRTLISNRVANKLGLEPRGKDEGATAASECYEATIFKIDFLIPDCKGIYDLEVRSPHLDFKDFDCIIGRDVLSFGELVYKGNENKIILRF
jgi:predicted aspartyl protease